MFCHVITTIFRFSITRLCPMMVELQWHCCWKQCFYSPTVQLSNPWLSSCRLKCNPHPESWQFLGVFSPDSWKVRGSYFSKIGLLIPTIPKWSWRRCRLVSLHLAPCMILACSWPPLPPCLPSFVFLHDLHSALLLAAAAALSPFICLPAWSPFWAALGCRCRLVSLHLRFLLLKDWVADPHNPLKWSWRRCRLVSLHLAPCMILACSWLPLPPSPFICLPSWPPLWAALGCRCRLVSQTCLPSWSPF